MNIKEYNALPSEYKSILESACHEANLSMMAKYDAKNPAALRSLVGNGTKLIRMPKDVMEAAFKEAMALYGELSAKNPNWKKVYEDYATFRREQNLWFRFAESGFDDFMQSQKL